MSKYIFNGNYYNSSLTYVAKDPGDSYAALIELTIVTWLEKVKPFMVPDEHAFNGNVVVWPETAVAQLVSEYPVAVAVFPETVILP